jgi:hypothetical protein
MALAATGLAAVGLAAASAAAQTAEARGSGRYRPRAVEADTFEVLSVSTLGRRIDEAGFGGFGQRGCLRDASHTDPTFAATQWTAQAGFAENEVMAATYTLPASVFPIKVELVRGLFVTSNTIVTTTTQWSVLVWEGTPETGTLVAEYSSDGDILPHLVMAPGNNATLVEVSVDPGDPEQIFITDQGGSHQFSIGFRVDEHNAQTGNGCLTPPPANRNAFPATDRDGLASPTGNWLKAVDCGPFGCAAGWTTFSDLGVCRPSGDWGLAAVWSSVDCGGGDCVADWNGDAVLDFFDVQGFLNDYSGMEPEADLNGDGAFDFFDVQSFLNLFSAGCP